ncbi:MAG TPA: hypothetical protein VK797_22750 [Tepidisphaeraceae bacterium]|jgi:hypothetical protein|nr:hypothetical protein [Tepidisphaeraceae bacterium]
MPDIHFELVIDPVEEARVKKMLSSIPNGARRALSGAINKTLEHGRTLLKKTITEELNISQKAALRALRLHRSTPQVLAGSINVSHDEVPMGEYHPVQTRQGVRVSVRKGGGSQLIRGAFIATMPLRGSQQREGHQGVFKRKPGAGLQMVKGKRKALVQKRPALPIRELYGPTAIGVLANNPSRIESIQTELQGSLSKNIESQIDRLKAGR